MTKPNPIRDLLQEDPRFRIEAYQFVREALAFAHDVLKMGAGAGEEESERHLTGQQLCEAIRRYALEQYGYMAQIVLRSWGITSTSDFGEIVYNLIRIGLMKKSAHDRREDFDGVYEFDQVFRENYRIIPPSASPSS
jgi:uncharacterized repeat protein (TIGR04138 family)